MIVRVVLWITVILLAPTFAVFFERPELELVLVVASCRLPIAAANNPQFLMLRRELNYTPIFKVTIAQRLFAFAATMGYLWVDQSFWALVVGLCIASILLVAYNKWPESNLHRYVWAIFLIGLLYAGINKHDLYLLAPIIGTIMVLFLPVRSALFFTAAVFAVTLYELSYHAMDLGERIVIVATLH